MYLISKDLTSILHLHKMTATIRLALMTLVLLIRPSHDTHATTTHLCFDDGDVQYKPILRINQDE